MIVGRLTPMLVLCLVVQVVIFPVFFYFVHPFLPLSSPVSLDRVCGFNYHTLFIIVDLYIADIYTFI